MAQFPDAIYTPRTMVNRAGATYDPLRTKDIYAEDFNKDRDEIVAIETELGENPKGAFASVKAWLTDLSGDISDILSTLSTIFSSPTITNQNADTDGVSFNNNPNIKFSDNGSDISINIWTRSQSIVNLSTSDVAIFNSAAWPRGICFFNLNTKDAHNCSFLISRGYQAGVGYIFGCLALANCTVSKTSEGVITITNIGDGKTYTISCAYSSTGLGYIKCSSLMTGTTILKNFFLTM